MLNETLKKTSNPTQNSEEDKENRVDFVSYILFLETDLFTAEERRAIDDLCKEAYISYKDIMDFLHQNPKERSEISKQKEGTRGATLIELLKRETPFFSLEMDISKVLARSLAEAWIESFAKNAFIPNAEIKKDIMSSCAMYIKDVENMFRREERDFSRAGFFVEDGVREYDILKKSGIIDGQGHILSTQKLLESPLIKDTPDTFHPNAIGPKKLANVPTIQRMREEQKSNRGENQSATSLRAGSREL